MRNTPQDKIGRKGIVDKLCNLLDNLTKDDHFCVALDGVWGSGKSFVVNMTEEVLDKRDEYIVVKYDAWENSFYDDPLIAILSCIIDTMQAKLSEIEGVGSALKQAGKEALNDLARTNSKVGVFVGVIQSISRIIRKFNKPFEKDTSKSAVADFKSYQELLGEVKHNLSKIIQNDIDKQNKLVILVDELDRCLPDEQLKILERLHHLFDLPNSAVIVAVNLESVAKNVNTMFGVDGEEYLRKFFDFKYKLTMSSEEYLNSLLTGVKDTLKKVNNRYDWDETIKSAYNCLRYGEKEVLNNVDNRELTRYYDSIVKACNGFGWEKLTNQYVFFLIIGLFIKKHLSPVFLSDVDVLNNQMEAEENAYYGRSGYYNSGEMPYYDYIDEYLGIDRKNMSEKIREQYGYSGNPLPGNIWYFNEIIYFSCGAKHVNNSMRIFSHKPAINIEDCQRLRQLALLYGGGEE